MNLEELKSMLHAAIKIVIERKPKNHYKAKNLWHNFYSNFSPCRVIDVDDVVPFPDPVKKRPCCGGMVPPVVVEQRGRGQNKKFSQHHIQSMTIIQ